jgi:ABC-type phosphate transport system permease subunit
MVDSLAAYVSLTQSANYFIVAVPSIIVGIAGFLLVKYYFKLS